MKDTKTTKFSPGDRVIAKEGSFSGIVKGREYVVKQQFESFVELEGHNMMFMADRFELRPKEKLVITTDGRNAEAKYIKGGEVKGKVTLKRSDSDPHDLKKLAAYAVQKLFPDDGNNIIVVKSGYTGSVCVVNSKNPLYKDGRILEFYGGRCVNAPTIGMRNTKFDTLDAIKDCAKRHIQSFEVIELHRN